MLERLISESRHLVVLFCKYLAYIIIALTHTCYLLKNYKPSVTTPLPGGPVAPVDGRMAAGPGGLQQQQQQQLNAGGGGGVGGYMPVDRVRGLANES